MKTKVVAVGHNFKASLCTDADVEVITGATVNSERLALICLRGEIRRWSITSMVSSPT